MIFITMLLLRQMDETENLWKKIVVEKPLIKIISSFIYEGGSVVREGCGIIGLPQDVFEIALDHFFSTGENKLKDFDSLMKSCQLALESAYPDYPRTVINKEIVENIEKSLNRETFWNIFAFYSRGVIEKIKEAVVNFKNQEKKRNTLEYKRKKFSSNHSLKTRVLDRDNWTCVQCKYHYEISAGAMGCEIDRNEKNLAVDHILPLALGGGNELENLQTLCVDCHVKKTKKDLFLIRNKEKSSLHNSSFSVGSPNAPLSISDGLSSPK